MFYISPLSFSEHFFAQHEVFPATYILCYSRNVYMRNNELHVLQNCIPKETGMFIYSHLKITVDNGKNMLNGNYLKVFFMSS